MNVEDPIGWAAILGMLEQEGVSNAVREIFRELVRINEMFRKNLINQLNDQPEFFTVAPSTDDGAQDGDVYVYDDNGRTRVQLVGSDPTP